MAEGQDGAEHETARRWFLDACVLFPQLTRGLLIGAADAGMAQIFWSTRVLEEWRIAAARAGGMAAEAEVRALTARLTAAYPQTLVEPDPEVEAALRLPDPGDAHVAAGAATARALIVTLNMRDFPARRLTPHGLEAVHPDGLLWGLLEEETERFAPVVGKALADLARPVGDGAGGRSALKRAGLGRLGKAWAAQMA